jgi:hypothetical protein
LTFFLLIFWHSRGKLFLSNTCIPVLAKLALFYRCQINNNPNPDKTFKSGVSRRLKFDSRLVSNHQSSISKVMDEFDTKRPIHVISFIDILSLSVSYIVYHVCVSYILYICIIYRILSKPNFNQQLSWTEFEVRLHSYTEVIYIIYIGHISYICVSYIIYMCIIYHISYMCIIYHIYMYHILYIVKTQLQPTTQLNWIWG